MSRCSLQLYVNKNFTFSRPSLASSDEFLKNLSSSDWKKTSLTTSHKDAGVLRNYTLPINKNCVQERLSFDHYDGYHPILTSYLLRHTRSVEAYRRIRKQQEEILNLCRKKLSKKLSRHFLSGIRDEDIIKALKIIQDTELQQNKPNTSDNIIRRVLKGIISNDSKWSSKAERDGQTSAEERVLKCLSQNISYSSGTFYKPRKGYSAVLKKLRTLFKKPRIYTNPFRVANKLANPTTNAKSKASLCCPTKSVDSVDDNRICPYNIESLTENIRIYASPAYGETSQNPHIGMGSKPTCACHRNLVKLQNEFIKQQSEIRLINQNLEQCLCILHDIGDKPQASRTPQYNSNPFKKDIQVYNVAANPPSGPYGDRTPKLIAYQDPSTPTRIQVKPPKKKGGGCCGKKKKVSVMPYCPPECKFGKMVLKVDAMVDTRTGNEEKEEKSENVVIVQKPQKQLTVLTIEERKPKRRKKCCGCCGRRNIDVTSISTDSTETQTPEISNADSAKPLPPADRKPAVHVEKKAKIKSVESIEPIRLYRRKVRHLHGGQSSQTRLGKGCYRRPRKAFRESRRRKRARKLIPRGASQHCSQNCAGFQFYGDDTKYIKTSTSAQTIPLSELKQTVLLADSPPLVGYKADPDVLSVPSAVSVGGLPPPPAVKKTPSIIASLRALSKKSYHKHLPQNVKEMPCIACTKDVKNTKCQCKKCRPKKRKFKRATNAMSTTSTTTASSHRSIGAFGRSRSRLGPKKSFAEKRKAKAEKRKNAAEAKKTSGKKKKCSLARLCKLILCRGT